MIIEKFLTKLPLDKIGDRIYIDTIKVIVPTEIDPQDLHDTLIKVIKENPTDISKFLLAASVVGKSEYKSSEDLLKEKIEKFIEKSTTLT